MLEKATAGAGGSPTLSFRSDKKRFQKKWLGEVVEDAPEEMGVVPPPAAADLVAAAPTVADLIRQVSRKNLTATYSILENGLPQI